MKMSDEMQDKESLEDLAALLRENYWHMSVTGAEAMRDLWSEFASNSEGFEETAREMGVSMDDLYRAANMFAEWLRSNSMINSSPMEASVEIRKEKLRVPEGPK